MIFALVILPLLAGLAAFALPSSAMRRSLLVGTALAHAALAATCWKWTPAPALGGWLALDAAGLLFLSITSGLFLVVSFYVIGYLGQEANRRATDMEEGFLFDNAPEAVFIGCLLLFLAAMTLVTVSQHFGLIWVAIEATTLASAPLIYFHRHHRSLEATWKYLLICSVGIALALLANFFLGVAATQANNGIFPMVLSDLVAHAQALQMPWLKVACLLFFVGYGTKMGLAPLHTWLPDAHSEAPSAISALLSGAVLNCAFLGLIRVQQVCVAAGLGDFGRDVWLALGLVSVVVGAVFILGQTDYKRLLAYSSVEHMGLLALGVGLGGVGAFGAMLHAVNHSLAKVMLVPAFRKHPGPLPDQEHHPGARLVERRAGDRAALDRGVSGHHRHTAVRIVPEQIHHPESRVRRRSRLDCDNRSGLSGGDFHRHDDSILRHGARRSAKANQPQPRSLVANRASRVARIAGFVARSGGAGKTE